MKTGHKIIISARFPKSRPFTFLICPQPKKRKNRSFGHRDARIDYPSQINTRKQYHSFAFARSGLAAAACSASYKKAEAFDLRTSEHRHIAVFPFWIKPLGSPPDGPSPEELDAPLWQESFVLQQAFYRQLQEMQKSGDSLRIRIQPVSGTLAIIEREDFTLDDLTRKVARNFPYQE